MRHIVAGGLARRNFIAGSAAAVLGGLLPPPKLVAQAATTKGAVSVKQLGAVGDGTTDDTRAFQQALKNHRQLYVPAGTYAVRQIQIPGSRVIRTDGVSTRFRQLPGQPNSTPILVITGSNVALGSCTVIGNIATDAGEWMHGVQISASETIGSLLDITVGDIVGQNIRGDVLYLGARPGNSLSRITAGNISGDNVYRNVVSITGTGAGGGAIRIERITGTRVGIFHFDIEPDRADTPVTGVSVGSIEGRNVSVSAQTGSNYADDIMLEKLDLSGDSTGGSSPDYPATSFVRPYGLQVRNTKALTIKSLSARGYDGEAIMYVQGELGGMLLTLGTCTISDCGLSNTSRAPSIQGAGNLAKIVIDQLTLDVAAGLAGVSLCENCELNSVEATLGAGARLLDGCTGASVKNLTVSGSAGDLAMNTSSATFDTGTGDFGTIAYNCDQLLFRNMTLTGNFAGQPATQQHHLENTTLNGLYYDDQIYQPLV